MKKTIRLDAAATGRNARDARNMPRNADQYHW